MVNTQTRALRAFPRSRRPPGGPPPSARRTLPPPADGDDGPSPYDPDEGFIQLGAGEAWPAQWGGRRLDHR